MEGFDVAVIGAGHAGIEAALASARLGARTAVFTLSLDAIGNMPCNPSIGGTAKGHLVFELDALGGEMPKAADATALMSRMLNLAKGPAVHSLRVQCDRRAYQQYMKRALEKQEGLSVIQDEVTGIELREGAVGAVVTRLGARFPVRCAVIATGTYLGGRIYVGEASWQSGPDSIGAAVELSRCLAGLGLPLRRFKTGTPARVHRRSIQFDRLAVQVGDEPTVPFCILNEGPPNRAVCHVASTNEATHEVIRRAIGRSPLYNGTIEGIGPRYCPSIEDKVMRFPDKNRHSFFVEPCGADTQEMYLQGMSSSLPYDVQVELYRTIEGFEHVELMRAAYAIEYDCVDPLSLSAGLAVKDIPGLYGCGQFCGTSGYEEAAAQGLVAGVNAARRVKGLPAFLLARHESYIGALIDDLTVKGTNEPYRMMTSRSEYRLALRQDNAGLRLSAKGREIGLLDDARYALFAADAACLRDTLELLDKTVVAPGPELNRMLRERAGGAALSAMSASSLLRRPGVTIDDLSPFLGRDIPARIARRAETEIKYEGYIRRQQTAIERAKRLEDMHIPPGIDYALVRGLRTEARDKLQSIRPVSLGAAGRISGVNPADVAVLTVYLNKGARRDG